MPTYIDISTGVSVDAAAALLPNGRTKPGFKALVGPGDYVSFNLALADAKPAGHAVFLTDEASDPFSDFRLVRDAARGRGSIQPPARPAAPSAQNASADDYRGLAAVRDAARLIAIHN